MKKQLLFYSFCFVFLSNTTFSQTQSLCEKKIAKAKKLLNEKAPFNTGETVFNLIYNCAVSNGNAVAENMLGLLYLNGIGTNKNQDLAFKYINSSASKNNSTAQYNLGRLYKYGIGCELSFDKAIKYFSQASLNGNQRAAYTLGYMYFKGFGVTQDYEKAVQWFKKSTDNMAQHYLGLCYYLGYGVVENEQKALELLLKNPTGNSKTLVNYIKEGQKEKNKLAILEQLSNNQNDSTFIDKETIEKIKIDETKTIVTPSEILKNWNAKLIQYDWSGKFTTRILPISIAFEKENDSINIMLTYKNDSFTSKAFWEKDILLLKEDIILSLDELYAFDKTLLLNYSLYSIRFTKKEILGKSYIIGYIDSFIEERTEFGEPLSLLLLPENLKDDFNEEMLKVLASQENQFIKLYPIPLKENLSIQYTLETQSYVQVELYSIDNATKIIVSPTKIEEKGTHLHSIMVNKELKNGIYIVKVIVGSKVYTRTIIKEN